MKLKAFLNEVKLVHILAAALLGTTYAAHAQINQPGGGWWYDPGRHGMQDLRALKPIEGCNVPGGLQRITSSDEPGQSAQFWCGPPPYCLTDAALPGSWNCTVVPFSRREPRGDPNGTPSANPVRDPDDLRCVNTGLPPISGRCPMPPSVSATFNGQATGTTVQVGQNVVLAISSPHAEQLRMTCTGANFGYSPFNLTNLDSYADTTHSFAPQAVLNAGTTNCTLTATNPRGSASATASFIAQNPPPAPTVRATFDPSRPTAGGTVQLETRTTNSTSLTWSCTGRWTNSNTGRATGTVRTTHNVPSSTGTATCTFTATGPGGTASTTASWTSVAGGGSGGGSSGGTTPTPLPSEPRFLVQVRNQGGQGGGGCSAGGPLIVIGQTGGVISESSPYRAYCSNATPGLWHPSLGIPSSYLNNMRNGVTREMGRPHDLYCLRYYRCQP